MATPPPDDAVRKRRSDFEQNRNLILEAADDAFADHGAGVSINVIAKRAGVAPATIYRHFPNRHALGKAVYELRIDLYNEVVQRAKTTNDPAEAFRQTIHGIVDLQARDRSFRDLIGTYEESATDVLSNSKLADFGTTMFASFNRAREAGVVRADVTNEDITLLLIASEGIARLASEQSEGALRRVVNLMLDGVMNTSTELDGSPLNYDELFKIT